MVVRFREDTVNTFPTERRDHFVLTVDTCLQRLRDMPKAEIHVHLEGATDAETSYEIARRNGAPLPVGSLEAWREFFAFKDFPHFIDVYRTSTDAIRTPADLALMVERFYGNQAALNVAYTESFVSMSLHLRRLSPGDILSALEDGAARGRALHGVEVAFIADISRESPETQAAVLDVAIAGRKRDTIIGIGLGGLEAEFPPHLFAGTYARARDAGLHVVAHAGEAAGPQSIRDAVAHLGAERIGHGVRVIESPALMAEMRDRGIPFEVCPQSNYALGIVPPAAPHPIRAMLDAGLHCTVNSDDPGMFASDLVAEYELLERQGFTWDELWALNASTLEATFLTDAEKEPHRAQWAAFAAEFANGEA